MLRKNLFIMLVAFLSLILMGTSTVFAHDEALTLTFTDMNQQTYDNYDQAPYKGNLTLTVNNNTNTTWTDFHFLLFDFYPYTSNVVFVTGACSWGPGGSCDPTKSPGALDSPTGWNLSSSGKTLDLFFGSSPVYNGQSVTFHVYTDNTSNQEPFALGFYPTNTVPVVPEPISSLLFVTGGTLLAGRRFLRNRVRS
jgi:hypothetical protein